MQRFTEGDHVRIDIPDTDDPEYDRFHDEYGIVVDVIDDAAGTSTGDERDSILYRVKLNDGTKMEFRWRDLRPR